MLQILNKYKRIAAIICLALLVIFPFIITNTYYLHIAIMVGVYVVLSLSLNLITGFTGQLCLGHAAFFGIGAYAGALLMLKFHMNFFLALIISFLSFLVSSCKQQSYPFSQYRHQKLP